MRPLTASAALAAALVLAGCSEGATDPQSGLTRQEAAELAALVTATSADLLDVENNTRPFSASRSSAEAAGGTFHQVVSVTAPCPKGGSVKVAGDVDVSLDGESNSGSIDAQAVLTHQGCGVDTEHGEIVLDGKPNLTFGAGFAWAAGAQTEPLRVSHEGGVSWERDTGDSGTCDVDLVAVTDFLARKRTIEGTFCGFSIQEELTWAPAT